MFIEHYVYFVEGQTYSGPYMTFESAFSHIARHQKDARIETADGKTIATWSTWTGLYKVGAKYKYFVVDNQHNRANYPDLVGKTLDEAPSYAIVKDVEVA